MYRIVLYAWTLKLRYPIRIEATHATHQRSGGTEVELNLEPGLNAKQNLSNIMNVNLIQLREKQKRRISQNIKNTDARNKNEGGKNLNTDKPMTILVACLQFNEAYLEHCVLGNQQCPKTFQKPTRKKFNSSRNAWPKTSRSNNQRPNGSFLPEPPYPCQYYLSPVFEETAITAKEADCASNSESD